MVAREAAGWAVPLAVLGVVFSLLAFGSDGLVEAVTAGLAALAFGLLAFVAYFFRDPERVVAEGVVSAADGRVRAVERLGDRWLVSVFLGVQDVHVNRLPLAGKLEAIEGSGHGWRPAYRPEAERNVQRRYRLATELGPVDVVQITGIVARRLVSFLRVGDRGEKGARFGMIVLGSRVDVLLPASRTEPTVRVGERVRAGSSTIARILP